MSICGFIFGKIALFVKIIRFVLPALAKFPSIVYRVNIYLNRINNFSVLELGVLKRTLVICILYFTLKNNEYKLEKENNLRLYLNIYVVGHFMSLFIPGIFARLNVYFYTPEVIIEAFIILYTNHSKIRLILLLLFILMNLTIYGYNLLTYYPELFNPYKSCLFN